MKKIHARFTGNVAMCQIASTGKRLELTDDPTKVTCKKCLNTRPLPNTRGTKISTKVL